jgi:hypothetical protein
MLPKVIDPIRFRCCMEGAQSSTTEEQVLGRARLFVEDHDSILLIRMPSPTSWTQEQHILVQVMKLIEPVRRIKNCRSVKTGTHENFS